MPMYDYKCERCGTVFETLQKFSDAPLKVHPGCGGAVERMISASALHFKGTGWYVTDYARKNGGSKAGTDGGSKPETASKPAESKPAKSSETTTSTKTS